MKAALLVCQLQYLNSPFLRVPSDVPAVLRLACNGLSPPPPFTSRPSCVQSLNSECRTSPPILTSNRETSKLFNNNYAARHQNDCSRLRLTNRLLLFSSTHKKNHIRQPSVAVGRRTDQPQPSVFVCFFQLLSQRRG